MTMPFYVSPEQQMKDRADYARKGIAQGRSVIVMQYEHGIMFAAENPSPALHKISEIYDKIAFAAAGRYNEFENLRVAGVRIADTRGYSYDRRDVTARGLANTYAQVLGTIFSSVGEKPYEVEIVVAEVGRDADSDEVYRMTFHGSVGQERGFAVMGGSAEQISTYVKERYTPGQPLGAALRLATVALGQGGDTPRTLEVGQLEVAVLDRTRTRARKFQRIQGAALRELLAVEDEPEPETTGADGDDATGQADQTDQTEAEAGASEPDAAADEAISDAELDDVLEDSESGDTEGSNGSAGAKEGDS